MSLGYVHNAVVKAQVGNVLVRNEFQLAATKTGKWGDCSGWIFLPGGPVPNPFLSILSYQLLGKIISICPAPSPLNRFSYVQPALDDVPKVSLSSPTPAWFLLEGLKRVWMIVT